MNTNDITETVRSPVFWGTLSIVCGLLSYVAFGIWGYYFQVVSLEPWWHIGKVFFSWAFVVLAVVGFASAIAVRQARAPLWVTAIAFVLNAIPMAVMAFMIDLSRSL